MKCPIDQTDLVMSERQGIEIDYCPTCRGVWLDRGELDKIIDRSDREHAMVHNRTHSPSPYASSRSNTYASDDHARNTTAHGGVAAMAAKVLHTLNESSHYKHGSYHRYDDDTYYKKKKKKSLVHQLLDF